MKNYKTFTPKAACCVAFASVLLGFSPYAIGETIDEDLIIQGSLHIQKDAVVDEAIVCETLTTSGNALRVKAGGYGSYKGSDVLISGGKGRIFGGHILLSAGEGELAIPGRIEMDAHSIQLKSSSIYLKSAVYSDSLQGLMGKDLVVAGGNGSAGKPYGNPGNNLILMGGSGGFNIEGGGFAESGAVVVETTMDLQGNTLRDARIEPSGGLSMGEFVSE
jgi:hypothetical protein